MKFSLEQLNWPHYYPLKVHVTFFYHTFIIYIWSQKYILFLFYCFVKSFLP